MGSEMCIRDRAPGIPESFRVLAKEMQSLGLNVEVIDDQGKVVVLKDEAFESDRAAEELGINLSRNEQLSSDTDFNTYQ